jgi:hypothetical protein
MKNLSDLINENENNKMFKYVVDVKIEGTVKAGSEGDAGELVDKEIDAIDGVVDYKIVSIDETEKDDTVEEAILLENDGDVIVDQIYTELINIYNERTSNLSPYYKALLNSQLLYFFNKQ